MKRFFRYGVLAICAAPLGFSVVGCSQNVGSDSGVEISKIPETTASPTTQSAPPKTPPANSQTTSAPAATKISWEPTLDAALQKARATQKPIMIDFFATWCGPCKMLDAEIYPAPAVVTEGQNFVSVKVDVDKETAAAQKYNISAMPTIVFLSASGQEIHRVEGASQDPQWMVGEMQTALSRITGTPA